MKGTRFLDDLARTLAEPMPRRRALRVLGVSVAAAAVPGLRPKPARATTSATGACGSDRRECQKGAEASFERYCCPKPSWQHLCGSERNGYACINTCSGKTAFPCTALIEDRFAGRNGVCCDAKLHAACNPAIRDPGGKIVRTSGGGSIPQCIPAPPCPAGRNRCREKCCPRGRVCVPRVEYTSDTATWQTDAATGRSPFQCCPRPAVKSCRSACCPRNRICCRGTCCPAGKACARSRGKDVCCDHQRVVNAGPGPIRPNQSSKLLCCPAGTIRVSTTQPHCCPPGAPDCCPAFDNAGNEVDCRATGRICVRGECVAP